VECNTRLNLQPISVYVCVCVRVCMRMCVCITQQNYAGNWKLNHPTWHEEVGCETDLSMATLEVQAFQLASYKRMEAEGALGKEEGYMCVVLRGCWYSIDMRCVCVCLCVCVRVFVCVCVCCVCVCVFV